MKWRFGANEHEQNGAEWTQEWVVLFNASAKSKCSKHDIGNNYRHEHSGKRPEELGGATECHSHLNNMRIKSNNS